jgi:hypothetical protein
MQAAHAAAHGLSVATAWAIYSGDSIGCAILPKPPAPKMQNPCVYSRQLEIHGDSKKLRKLF